ncbi:MAG: DUF4922 domain-containing protein [Ignavibacteriales bacterium]|nr:DUF4922 domain-containing protein [Ignavibacteriales bacterium]
MINEKIFAVYDKGSSVSLPELSVRLLEEQQLSWTQLAEGVASLASVVVREIKCSSFSAYLQRNPQRIVSTAAKVDTKTIRERKCFLCVENLPAAQKGVLCNGEFLVLCNPAPIFKNHFTISNVKHIPQSIEAFVGTFFQLAKDLSPALTVFYNGPKCGASAPDHMHFQASPTGAIPVERDATDSARRILKAQEDAVAIYTLKNYGRQVVVLESGDKQALEATLLKFISAMRKIMSVTEEPMLNILCSYSSHGWRLIIFPRKKHRPEAFFKEGDEKVLISPAAVDIGGLIVTPIEKDFNRVDARMIEGIFNEVSLEAETVGSIINDL